VGCRSPDVMPGVDHERADSRRGPRRAPGCMAGSALTYG
jgi:hypothetical protein